MNSPNILWITTIIMTLGGLAILALGKRRTPSEEIQTVLHGIVPLIAACSYFAMAIGQGEVLLPADLTAGPGATRIFYYGRYIDWTFTTPLLLITVCLTAMHAGKKRAGAIAGVVLADLMMILTALFFGASEILWIKWTWFIISCAAFLGVYFVLWVSNIEAAATQRADVQSSYKRHAAILSVLWLIYPLVLAVAPDGLNIMSDAASVLAIAVLDVVSKVVYGLMTVSADAKATDHDLAELRATTPAMRAA